MQPKYGSTSLCDQNVAYRAWTETRTDKSLKTEGPKILSNDIFYFRNVIIGGPKKQLTFFVSSVLYVHRLTEIARVSLFDGQGQIVLGVWLEFT